MIVFFNYFFPIYIFPKNIESQTCNRDQGEGALALGRNGVEEQPEYSIVSKKMDWQVAKMAFRHIWDNWQDSHHEFWVVIWRLGPRLTELLWFSFLKAIFQKTVDFAMISQQTIAKSNTEYLFSLVDNVTTSRSGAEGVKEGEGVDEVEAGVRPRIPPTWWNNIFVTLN